MTLPNSNRSERNVGYWCSKITRAIRVALDARLSPWGLNFSAAMLLLILDRAGPQSIGQLARESGHTHPSVLKLVNTLASAGLVTAAAKPEDRRVRTVALTAAGKQRLVEIFDILTAVNREAVTGLNGEMQEQLLLYLRQIHGNMTIAHQPAQENHPALVVGLPSSPRTR